MKFLKLSIFIFYLAYFFISVCQANVLNEPSSSVNGNSQLQRSEISVLPINYELFALISQLKQNSINSQTITSTLNKLTSSNIPFNAAEQFLILIAQARLKESNLDSSNDSETFSTNSLDVLLLLQQAEKLSEKISVKQLTLPEFFQLDLMLANHYNNQGKYELAYLHKTSYLNNYSTYRNNKRLAMVATLEQSFELMAKKANNALMENHNKLKTRRVAEVQDEKTVQQFNFTLVITISIVFVLLFFRQLSIRNKLIYLAKTDALTGLFIRTVFFAKSNNMIKKFVEQPEELSVLLLDLDHFKKINENYGHQVGDQTLIIVSQLIKETMRSRDILSRLGGEVFAALLPFADNNKAKAIAMRINDKIAKYDFSLLMFQSKVTISIGVATMKDSKMSFDDLLYNAEFAMYQAKEQGRNTVVCFRDIAPSRERRAN